VIVSQRGSGKYSYSLYRISKNGTERCSTETMFTKCGFLSLYSSVILLFIYLLQNECDNLLVFMLVLILLVLNSGGNTES
jgi:hypothetical protein